MLRVCVTAIDGVGLTITVGVVGEIEGLFVDAVCVGNVMVAAL